MNIIHGWPPNITAIRAAFPLQHDVIFAWAPDTVYAPGGGPISPALMAHERTHCRQQGTDPEGWWARYIADPEFRLAQEVEAHRAEWRAFRNAGKSPKHRRRYLGEIATRLAAPLYGGLVTQADALALILETPKLPSLIIEPPNPNLEI